MKHIKDFREAMGFGPGGEEILSDVDDILQELRDAGLEAEAKHSIGGKASYGKVGEEIAISIKSKSIWNGEDCFSAGYEESDIIDVYERICRYLESEGFEKDLVARNGYVGSVPHLRISSFMGSSSSHFSFSRMVWPDNIG